MPAWVYRFGPDRTDGHAGLTEELGGKGANLAEMSRLGLPVPPGFTISTRVCRHFFANGEALPDGLEGDVREAVAAMGQATGAAFGDPQSPLLLAVRSGAAISMPGMMDTILNLGLNDETVAGLARASGDERFAYDSYRRFIEMYGDVVLGVDHGLFADLLDNFKNLNALSSDTELSAAQWREVIARYQDAIRSEIGRDFPQDTNEQLWGAINAVLRSWRNERADSYRHLHAISEDMGTAVTVQAMVFGNRGETSATGVAFTRNPATGANEIYGEYLPNAQGEDIVAGTRTPLRLTEKARAEMKAKEASLETVMPGAFAELKDIFARLEVHYRDMQDVEFTIQEGKVWMLQTRSGKRSAEAALKIAVDLVEEEIISRDEAVMMVEPQALSHLLHPRIEPGAAKDLIARGLPASPGAATGEIVLTSEEAEVMRAQGRHVILVRVETSAEDINGMSAAVGVLTQRGGLTSHAAVVARSMGLPCISGAGSIRIDLAQGTVRTASRTLKRGDTITIDGTTGEVLAGAVPMKQPELSADFATLIAWADTFRGLKVRANADTPRDTLQAKKLGAEGIGLCRTEHMFFDASRILAMREMICASDEKGRRAALAKILPMQRSDFAELFRIMDGAPVTIRLLDPPLHEFLPRHEAELAPIAEALGITLDRLKTRVAELSEFNPMLGFRGCRLAIRYPEITEMQARAIFEAAIEAGKAMGHAVKPEIMIPLVAYRREFDILADVIRSTAAKIEAETGQRLTYQIGTMIELPRAALRGKELSEGPGGAEFFSFGTNDLTQTTLGLSRDDAAPILSNYAGKGIFERDPFVSIDEGGVGELIRIGIAGGRAGRAGLKIGICGEHGGDATSVAFFHELGLDYVSCSPFRVPIARLAAARAAITARRKGAS
ncbi:MAG: pyruvate, phosphate dikinase [Hyphomicrobium sp. 32-62-53]|nr:MAG: pyruvate, phosphate dikinase [Hyphomicrobium sp. 12-62-95]OYY00294.1 MAG: pyruvate, phosphate dikinase [Hyphomicrobium sp. 32-62-53]